MPPHTPSVRGKVGLDLAEVVLEGLLLELDKVGRHVRAELSRPVEMVGERLRFVAMGRGRVWVYQERRVALFSVMRTAWRVEMVAVTSVSGSAAVVSHTARRSMSESSSSTCLAVSPVFHLIFLSPPTVVLVTPSSICHEVRVSACASVPMGSPSSAQVVVCGGGRWRCYLDALDGRDEAGGEGEIAHHLPY